MYLCGFSWFKQNSKVCDKHVSLFNNILHFQLGKGQNYENHNVENQKELRKLRRRSERRNGLFSWSERQNQNVENVFWVDQNSDDQNIENSIKNKKLDFRRSDFTYGFKTDQNVKNLFINYLWRITYGYQGLWGVGLGSIRLG